jgi:hypothetical protein
VVAILARDRVHDLWHVRSTARFWERSLRRPDDRDPPVGPEREGQVAFRPDPETMAAAVRRRRPDLRPFSRIDQRRRARLGRPMATSAMRRLDSHQPP